MNKKYRAFHKPPSQWFLDSLIGAGQIEMTCGWCLRYHMAPDTQFWDQMSYSQEAYREACLNERDGNPEGVILQYGVDGIYAKEFSGTTFVVGCPCNGLGYFEDLVWSDRRAILTYIEARSKQENQWAEEARLINKINQSAKCQIEN
jgi:hypothetical protein